MTSGTAVFWKLRRIAAGLRQKDVAGRAGMSMTRYSAIERGELQPSHEDREFIERILPPLPKEVTAA
ncbi:MAG: helix-turn-helix transcriptional regulator [Candidatus Acidiferrales bacterium]